jgi:hypothetical protein
LEPPGNLGKSVLRLRHWEDLSYIAEVNVNSIRSFLHIVNRPPPDVAHANIADLWDLAAESGSLLLLRETVAQIPGALSLKW